MSRIRLAIGLALILGGMALGLYVGIIFAAVGCQEMKDGSLAKGILLTALWSELIGIGTASALVVPGVLVLRGLKDRNRPGT